MKLKQAVRAAHAQRMAELRRRGDDGNLVAVLVLVGVLSLVIAITVAALIPTFTVATTSQQGEQAVAQANAGLSDALFHLDSLGDNPSSFCVGNFSQIPSNLLSGTGITNCYLSGSSPLPSAPGVKYYVAKFLSPPSTTIPAGVTDEFLITSYAVVNNQRRIVSTLVYRVEDSYGLYGLAGFFDSGALKQSNVYEVGGFPATSFASGGQVDIGVGPYGNAQCSGNNNVGNAIQFIAQTGATNSTSHPCPNWTPTTFNVTPTDPVVNCNGQQSSPFSPCMANSNPPTFATYNNDVYCPLYGAGIPNTVSTSTNIAGSQDPPPPGSVFDCRTGGAAVTIGLTCTNGKSDPCTSTPNSCPMTLPFGFTTIPSGTYYFDSNTTVLADLDSKCFATSNGQVSIFDLPQGCNTATPCPLYQPSAGSNLVAANNTCVQPPGANTNVTLTLTGSYINSGPTPASPFDFTPGDPSNFSFYWTGNNIQVNSPVYDGLLYAPAAIWNPNGTGYETFGTLAVDCISIKGSPNLYFVYPQHPRGFLQNWTISNYTITP
jgi:hypothetical protein